MAFEYFDNHDLDPIDTSGSQEWSEINDSGHCFESPVRQELGPERAEIITAS